MLGTFITVWALGFCFNTGIAVILKEMMNDEKLLNRDALITYAAFGPLLSVMLVGGFIYSIGIVVMRNVRK